MSSRSSPTSTAASNFVPLSQAHRRCGHPHVVHSFSRTFQSSSDPERCFPLTADDFARVNPNTGTAPIFRTRRDATLTTAIYRRRPVLVERVGSKEIKAWPLKYSTMFHMTNDSHLFRTQKELEEEEGAYPVGGNRWRNGKAEWVPLYEGKMAQAFDHRAASVVMNLANQHRPAQPAAATLEEHLAIPSARRSACRRDGSQSACRWWTSSAC